MQFVMQKMQSENILSWICENNIKIIIGKFYEIIHTQKKFNYALTG